MSLSLEDVRRVAQLARIEINDREAESVHARLREIFSLIEELQAVDTAGVVPMAHAGDAVLRLREDRVTEDDRHAEFQRAAPQVEGGLYLVPRVIE